VTVSRASLVLAGFLSAIGASGCAFFEQPRNVEVTRSEVERLRAQQAEVLALLRELRTRSEDHGETLATLRADTNFNLEELEKQIEILRAQLEDQGVRFERIQREVSDRMQRPPSPNTRVPYGEDTTAAASRGEDPADPPALSASDLYDAAYRDFSRGNYELAVSGFREVLRHYPDMELSDNAQYWIGECYYGLGDLDKAVLEYLKVRDLYPDGDKVAAATLKTGYAFLRKGDSATARRYFETVLREFPNSDEATLARDKLDSIR